MAMKQIWFLKDRYAKGKLQAHMDYYIFISSYNIIICIHFK